MLTRNTKTLCLQDLFRQTVRSYPQKTALTDKDRSYSYQELDQISDIRACYLRAKGLKEGELAGIMMNRSDQAIITILAVLKAGGAYVPLDPQWPSERVTYVCEHTGLSMVLYDSFAPQKTLKPLKTATVSLTENEGFGPSDDQLSSVQSLAVNPEQLCYVLYTSGSTGQPKGIMTEHRNVVSFCLSFNSNCKVNSEDRILQGFSLGFDGSVEEMWMAFSNGANLVIGDHETVRIPEDLTSHLIKHKISVFSTVPTLLKTLNPQRLSSLRLLILSGEPCPPDLVSLWAVNGRRMLNVYGPTETTVNTTVAECLPGQRVTIGKPIQGYSTWVLDSSGRQVKNGDPGELYIGGLGLARGYLGRPDLTGTHFICTKSWCNDLLPDRLYKTGDLVRVNENGDLEFLGRLDHQVKIRGFRVEIPEIESVLNRFPGVTGAIVKAVTVRDKTELAAWITTDSTIRTLDRGSLRKHLTDHLPVYMVPGWLDTLPSFPTLSSGKADRKSLPAPVLALTKNYPVRTAESHMSKTENQIKKIWTETLAIDDCSTDDDFFTDLGGYSLLAAEAVTKIRSHFDLPVSMRDLYKHPTISGLSKMMDELKDSQKSSTESSTNPSQKPQESFRLFKRMECLKLLSLTFLYGWLATPTALALTALIQFYQNKMSTQDLGLYLSILALGTYPIHLCLVIASKWLLIGRYRSGSWDLNSFYFFRWWLASKWQQLSGVTLFNGTPLVNWYLRAMGAKVGKHTLFETLPLGAYDLLKVGSQCTISAETRLSCYKIQSGRLITGAVSIGDHSYIGIHSAMGINSSMGHHCVLDDLSFCEEDARIPDYEIWSGAPAKKSATPLSLPHTSTQTHTGVFVRSALHGITSLLTLGVLSGSQIIPVILLWYAWTEFGITGLAFSVIPSVAAGVLSFALTASFWRLLILPRPVTGTIALNSFTWIRKWNADLVMRISHSLMKPVYTTIYFPVWLRLLGAKTGKGAEVSTVSQIAPELTHIGSLSFFADGSMICSKRIFNGSAQIQKTSIGTRSFVGNNALLPPGQALGHDCLLACMSRPPSEAKTTKDGTEWLGSPSFVLPHRKRVTGFSQQELYNPGIRKIVLRSLIDGMRILIPGVIGTLQFLLFSMVLFILLEQNASVPFIIGAMSLLSVLQVNLSALIVIILKKLVMGTFKPVIRPLWSPYVWLNEMINGAWESVSVPSISLFIGTKWFNQILRGMGCHIGKNCYIETSLFSEFDLVHIGDQCCLNQGVVIQNHLFEDRIMKSSHLYIGDQCNIGEGSVILYDSETESGTSIFPLSLVMKGEKIHSKARWVGIPAEPTSFSSKF